MSEDDLGSKIKGLDMTRTTGSEEGGISGYDSLRAELSDALKGHDRQYAFCEVDNGLADVTVKSNHVGMRQYVSRLEVQSRLDGDGQSGLYCLKDPEGQIIVGSLAEIMEILDPMPSARQILESAQRGSCYQKDLIPFPRNIRSHPNQDQPQPYAGF